MACASNEFGSLRFSRRERELALATLLLSLLVHYGLWQTYHTGSQQGWWKHLHLPAWMHFAAKNFPLQAQLGHLNQPEIFVDVSSADVDAPTRTRYYSNKSSRAANPETGNQNAPKITGTQTGVPKTEEAPRPIAPKQPPQPAAQKVEATPPMSHLQPTMPAPELEKPQTPGETDLPQPQPSRPRTLKQALAQRDPLAGQKLQQEGGVPRHSFTSSLDVKATAFGDYDRAIIEAVQQRWYDLLDNHRYAQDRSGKVSLHFKLKYDGTIIEMQTVENNVGQMLGYLCQEAIEEAAPFAKWPPDMVAIIGSNYREITFTFYYY